MAYNKGEKEITTMNKTTMSHAAALFAAIVVAAGTVGCAKVDTNEIGFKTRWGKIDSGLLEPGLYFINPIGVSMVTYDARVVKSELKSPTYTKDMQLADMRLTITYAVDRNRVTEIHSDYGRKEWAKTIVYPVVVSATKDIIGQWEADKLINGRQQAEAEINRMVKERLADKPVSFNELVIEDVGFSDAFESAIEAKQIATQEAIKAKNKTLQIEEESRQEVIRAEAKAKATIALAKAEAEALEIRGKALKENQDLIRLQFIEKWNGVAPNTLILGGDSAKPLMNVQ